MITERDYPITLLWVFKPVLIMIFISIVLLFFDYWIPYFAFAIPYFLIANPLIRANFHYVLDAKVFTVREGVLSKKERNIPYGVIQHVFVKQDLFDRMFGLATLALENAGGEEQKQGFWSLRMSSNSRQGETLGSQGSKVNLPGLRLDSANALRDLILQKIKENPLDDNQSGL